MNAGRLTAAARRGALVVLVPAVLGGTAAAQEYGGSGSVAVAIGFSDYRPMRLDVVRGETVRWSNNSVRRHTVTADDGSFDSGSLGTGEAYERRFDASGEHPYHCWLHPGITGAVSVHAVVLDAPAEPAAPGQPYPLNGRAGAPEGTPVVIEEERAGGFAAVAQTRVDAERRFSAAVHPTTSARYRAVVDGEPGPPVQLLVLDRAVRAFGIRRGRHLIVRAQVTPASPGATVVLQLRLRERFGWWPVRAGRLDGASAVRFRIRRRGHVRARVVLTLADGATVLAVSPVLRLKARTSGHENGLP